MLPACTDGHLSAGITQLIPAPRQVRAEAALCPFELPVAQGKQPPARGSSSAEEAALPSGT